MKNDSFHPMDLVSPVTEAGLQLSVQPTNGTYNQKYTVACVFKGVGEVIETREIVIDYDGWDGYDGLGKVIYGVCLVQCDSGIGWAGAGALRKWT